MAVADDHITVEHGTHGRSLANLSAKLEALVHDFVTIHDIIEETIRRLLLKQYRKITWENISLV